MSGDQIGGWILTIVLGGLSLAALVQAWIRYRLTSRGRWTEAEIVRVDEDKDTDGDPRFYPVVAFILPGGERIEAKSLTGKPYPPGLTSGVGSKVSVRYDPATPTRIELSGYEADGVLMNLFLGLLLAGVAWLGFYDMVLS